MLDERVLPFKRDELLKPLEQWFFGYRQELSVPSGLVPVG